MTPIRSIRSYLLTRVLGSTALVLAAAGAGVYVVVARSLEGQFDRNLADRLQGFASILFQTADHVEFEFSEQLMPEYARSQFSDYFELRFEDGELLERSASLEGADLEVPEPPTRTPHTWSGRLPDGRSGRYVSQLIEVHHVYPEEGPDRPEAARIQVVIARGREVLVAVEQKVLLQCVVVSLVLMTLIAFLAWRAVVDGLEPARRLATTLDAIRVDRLPKSLDVGPLPAELAPVASKTGALLERLDAALERERRTTADIAHELRTPISEAITVAEVALRDGRDPALARRALATLRDVAWRMGRSVSTILKLARLEMGAETFSREEVDLAEIARDLLRSLASVERERGIRVENLVEPGETVEGDRDVLAIVLSNVLSNALTYSPEGSSVVCRFVRGPAHGGWRFVVENDGGDLRPEDLRSLSEPFWRKDRARADRERSGLGLALSRALAERAGMELFFELEGRTFRAVLAGQGARAPAPATSVPD